MIKTNPEIEIPTDPAGNPFANDCLYRKQSIEDLSSWLVKTPDPLVLSINAQWGAGKTTFVKLWQAYLRKEYKMESIYFSAWENDYSADPLAVIISKLGVHEEERLKRLKEIALPIGGERLKYLEKLKETALLILKKSIFTIIEKTTQGLITEDLIDLALKDSMDPIQKQLKELKTALGELMQDQPLIIFVDELDRCRPLYAIEFLERIKHIFNVPGLIFILSIDKTNLAKSIKSQYGDIDTDNYLRRFIHLEYPLKNPSVDRFCDVLFDHFELNDPKLRDKDMYKDFFKELFKEFDLSLRQIEHIFTKLSIVFHDTSNTNIRLEYAILILEALKSYDSNLYAQVSTGSDDAIQKVENKIRIAMKNIGNRAHEYPTSVIRRLSGRAVDNEISYEGGSFLLPDQSVIDQAIKKVEFADKFTFTDQGKI